MRFSFDVIGAYSRSVTYFESLLRKCVAGVECSGGYFSSVGCGVEGSGGYSSSLG
jgi:hypothetical protein